MAVIIDHELAPSLISMPEAIDALGEAYRQLAEGHAVETDRSNLILPHGWLRTMAAALLDEGVVGYKEFHRFHGRSRMTYHLFDAETGEQLALLDARYLTALRTGACGGLAARLLAPSGASVLGVIGSGAEARTQVQAILTVCPIQEVRVFSRTAERREGFCHELRESCEGLDVMAVDGPDLAIAGSDILIVATNTAGSGPSMRGVWLPDEPLLVNSIGSTLPDQRELDADVWERARRVVIDAGALLEESGDAIAARAAGTLHPERITTLADLVGTSTPLADGGGVTLYKSAGSALQDVAVAARMYRNACALGDDLPVLDEFQSVRTVAS